VEAVSVRREITAGVTTFLTMSYVVVVTPSMLSQVGMPFDGVLAATVLLAFSMTLLMGVYARLPYAVAPGMGINAFFAYTLIAGKNIPWPVALGCIAWAGVCFLVVSLTPLRRFIAQAIPSSLRHAAAVGIGLFLAFIGFKNAGIVVSHPATLVTLGPLNTHVLLSVLGLVLGVVWMRRKYAWALMASIGVVAFLAWGLGVASLPKQWLSTPALHEVAWHFDMRGAFTWTMLPVIVSVLCTDLFDSLATLMGLAHASGMVDKDGEPKHLNKALLVDALATLSGGLLGCPSGTAYVESAAGIEAGGRTGLASVVTALCFLPCLFLAPLAGSIPACATAPVLIIVGALMFKGVFHLNHTALEEWVPSFLTVILIPLTFSITQGVLWGFIAHVVCYVLARRAREITVAMYALSFLAVVLLWLDHMH
jgi:AGZA family xanthine/uracil permease-like MFS transporter